MKAAFRHRFIRVGLPAMAMVTAYFLGQLRGVEQVNAAADQEEKARLAQYHRTHTPLALASIKNLSPDALLGLRMNSVKLGSHTVSLGAQGRYYVDGEDLGKLAKLDPRQALALLAALPHGKMTSEAYRYFFQQWSDLGPEETAKAVAAAAELPQGPEKIGVVTGLAVVWAKQDPAGALDWVAGLGDANVPALVNTLALVSNTQPALAAQYVQKIADTELRNKAILDIAARWGQANWNTLERTDTAATLAWLDQVATGAVYDQAVDKIFWSYGYMQPREGAALVNQLTDPKDRSIAIATLSIDWATGHPGDALDWLRTLPDSDSAARDPALKAALALWSKKNPDAASAYLTGLNDPALFTTLAPTIAPDLARRDPQVALNWVNGFPDSPEKTQAVSGVLATMAATDFDGAWNYAANLPPGPGRDGAMDSILSTLSRTDAAQAAARLDQLDSAAAQESASATVTAYWARQNPAALAEWIGTQPAGVVRDEAIAQYLDVQIAKNTTTALALVNTLSNEAMRGAGIRSVVLVLAKSDLPAARQAVQTANLTEAQRQSLLILLSQSSGK
jgi:hypothetical protein